MIACKSKAEYPYKLLFLFKHSKKQTNHIFSYIIENLTHSKSELLKKVDSRNEII